MIAHKRKWAPEEIAEIREQYASRPLKELASKFGVKPRQLAGIANYYGIKQFERRAGRPWRIKKVPASGSELNVLDLMESQYHIGQMLFSERDFEKAKKLEAIYKSMNEAINRSL